MKNKKIIIAGGSGFIGQAIANYFGAENNIVILGRQLANQQTNAFGVIALEPAVLKNTRFVKWDGKTQGEWTKELNGADLLLNLAGKTVNCRYTKKNKQEIFDSRTNAVKALGIAVQQCVKPPLVWMNAASATIYPFATDTARDESFTAFADDFSVQVCKLWEETFFAQRTPFTRKIALRMAITLGKGGVMKPYYNLLKFGLGGRQGSGKQLYSWIHIEDTCRIIEWLFNHTDMEGVYNLSSPGAVTNAGFMQTLRKATGHSCGLPAYEWMLRIGAKIIGTEPELVLKSRWVFPAKLLDAGYTFKYPELTAAVEQIVSQADKKEFQLF
ncbi:MAG: TIGR01777 family protein [Sphingobacteriales bacterium]|nr:MAG: TIGR01777 family protein [Sphingobacteriales bacterium]